MKSTSSQKRRSKCRPHTSTSPLPRATIGAILSSGRDGSNRGRPACSTPRGTVMMTASASNLLGGADARGVGAVHRARVTGGRSLGQHAADGQGWRSGQEPAVGGRRRYSAPRSHMASRSWRV